MRRHLLDTTPLAALLYGRPVAVARFKLWMLRHEAATSILVYGEVIEHIKRSPNYARHYASLQQLLGEVPPLFLTYSILERYADLRRQLRPPHGPGLIGDVDTLIAATALERNLTVVTVDTDFQRVPNLKVLLIERSELRKTALDNP